MPLTIDRSPARRPVGDATRREFIAGGLSLGVLMLAGCGGDDDGDRPSATAGDGFPITFEHRYGTTQIPSAPKRIVTAGFNDADYALAFGIVPVGVANFIGEFPEDTRPWAREALAGAEPPKVSNDDGELEIERIAALNPDLIIFYSFLEEADYRRLSQIAPTLTEPEEGTLWPRHTLDVGRALGRDDDARTLVRDVQGRFAQARDANAVFADTTAAIFFGVGDGGDLFSLPASDARSGFFTSLGLELPSRTGEISREQFELLDEDLLIIYGAERETIEGDPLFQRLDALRQGRVAYLGGFGSQFAGAAGFDSPLSLPVALDLAVPALAAALNGDGEPGATSAQM